MTNPPEESETTTFQADFSDETAGDSRYDGLPHSLIKACFDPFDYALGLCNGQVIRFNSANLSDDGKWVHLRMDDVAHPMTGVAYAFDRGLDVRVKDIVWVADAPEGS